MGKVVRMGEDESKFLKLHGTPGLTGMHGMGSYSGGRTADAFMSFIKGKLAEDKGFARVPALDRLASAFPHEARPSLAPRRVYGVRG